MRSFNHRRDEASGRIALTYGQDILAYFDVSQEPVLSRILTVIYAAEELNRATAKEHVCEKEGSALAHALYMLGLERP